MDRYSELANSILTELVGPSFQPPALVSPTVGTANITPSVVIRTPTPPATATYTGAPATPPLGPKVRGGGGALGGALTLAAVGWDVYKAIRSKYQERNAPLPMAMPAGYKAGDTVLPPLKPGGQGFATPQPIQPATLPDTAPEQQPAQKPQKPITLPNVVPGEPDYDVPDKPSPEPQPVPQPKPVTPPAPQPRPVVPPTPRPSEEPAPQPVPQPSPVPLPPSKTSAGVNIDTTNSTQNDPQSNINTGRGTDGVTPVPPARKIIPLAPLPIIPPTLSPDEVKSQKGDQFDFKSYPQGYNPKEPYGRWGPTSARRDNTKAPPEYTIKQPFNSDIEPPVASATPDTETGPWKNRYKRYKDWYEANPQAGQPTSFGNILKKSK